MEEGIHVVHSMKRGLVIGKFMPLHKGHVALIRFASAQCDELLVSLAYRPEDPIPGPLRLQWLKEEFAREKGIRCEVSLDDFDNESLAWDLRVPRCVAFLKKRFPPFDLLFSSEAFGEALASGLGAQHVSFDPERKETPLSGSAIRKAPMKYWDFIAQPAKPFYLKKICFYGPESTGKSTLARKLAVEFQTEFVPEVAREMITSNDFTEDDIIRIAHAQTARVHEKAQTANKILFCDTDLITTGVYSRQYLGKIPSVVTELERHVKYDQYFLFGIDVPWVGDGLRDLGDRRKEMYEIFRNELLTRGIGFVEANGSFEEREKVLREAVEKMIGA